MCQLSLFLPMADIANQSQHSLLPSPDKVSEFRCLKLALNMRAHGSFLLWHLQKGEAWVQLEEGSRFLSLLKMVPAGSGQREGAPQNVVSTALFRTHPVNNRYRPCAGG